MILFCWKSPMTNNKIRLIWLFIRFVKFWNSGLGKLSMTHHETTRCCWVVHMGGNSPAPRGPPTPLHRSVFVTGTALTGHGSIESRVEICRAIWPCISGCDGFRHKIRFFPTGFPVYIPQLLMYPDKKQNKIKILSK